MNSYKKPSALEPYRVLDLTEGGCMIGARMLGDLGADDGEAPRGKVEVPESNALHDVE